MGFRVYRRSYLIWSPVIGCSTPMSFVGDAFFFAVMSNLLDVGGGVLEMITTGGNGLFDPKVGGRQIGYPLSPAYSFFLYQEFIFFIFCFVFF